MAAKGTGHILKNQQFLSSLKPSIGNFMHQLKVTQVILWN